MSMIGNILCFLFGGLIGGACLGAGRLSLVHHDPRHSNREAVLQNGQAVSNALRGNGRVKLVCGSSHTAFF